MKLSGLINLSLLFYTALIITSLSSCYEPIEGCLDPLSSNFQLDGDNNCDDCCIYPSVDIEFSPMWDTINLLSFNKGTITSDTVFRDTIIMDTIFLGSMVVDINTIDTVLIDTITMDTMLSYLTNDAGQQLRINESQFFVSNIFLSGLGREKLSTQDSVSLECEPAETLYNTLDIISLENLSTEIQNSAIDFGYNTLTFDIGISDCLASIDTVGLTNSIPSLENLSTALVSENNYLSHQFSLEFEDNPGEEVIISFTNGEGLVSLSILNTIQDFSITRGSDLSIDIDVNYSEWFKNLLSSDSEETIKQKIIQNSETAFSLRN